MFRFLFLLLFFSLQATSSFAQAQLTISQATASTTYSSTYSASKTKDNNLSTYWRGASGKSSWWLKLDLGSSKYLNQISIYWSSTRGSANYNIQGSKDNSTWTNLYTGLSSLGGSTNPYQKNHTLTGSYRYIRIYINSVQSSYPIIYEAKLFADTTPPTGTVRINNNNQYATSTSVTLNLSATDSSSGMGSGAQMRFSNDNSTWSTAEAYAATKAWTLSSGNGTKTVYAKFKDVAGNWSSAVSDSIILDTVAPQTPTINPVTSPTTNSSQTLTGTKSTDAASILVTCSTATVGSVTYPTSTTWSCPLTNLTSGTNTITAKAKDAAGNESSSAITSIVYNPDVGQAPVVTDDGAYTSSTTLLHATWSISTPNIVEYQYSVGSGSAGATNIKGWTSTTYKDIQVTGLSLTVGTAYYFNVKAKNDQGIWSAVGSSDGITVDKAPEICTTTPSANSTFTETDSIPIYACANFWGANKQEFQVRVNYVVVKPWFESTTNCTCNGTGVSFTYPWQPGTGNNGSKVITIEARDNRVPAVSKQTNIFIYRKPVATP
ncbi:MAG: discoidin domain-containing protein [Candidatus Omnitrophota bacterium]